MTGTGSTLASGAPLDAPLSRGRGAAPLQRQLHQRLRRAIRDGTLAPGCRLPGSRALAEALGISRNTVIAVYEHLAAEGCVHPGRRGTTVTSLSGAAPPPGRSRGRQALALPAPASPGRSTQNPLPTGITARRLAPFASAVPVAAQDLPLRPGVPALAHFPLAAWRRAIDRALQRGGSAALAYGNPLGEPALRAAIAQHLAVARGVRCSPGQVVVTEGAQEALALCVRLLTNPGDTAWVEDPGYRGAKAAMHAGDLRVRPMRVDADGLQVTPADWQRDAPRLVYTTPSHQYPAGAVLGIARRLALIGQARRHGAWLIEDDYDSEYRHHGEPIAAMQGLTEAAPVLYVGTFSKTMFPALRLGFLVLPEALLEAVRAPLHELLRGGHRVEQLAMADFIDSGQFGRHLRRMRRLYRERQQALRQALARHFALPHAIAGGECGLHLVLRLPGGPDDRLLAAAAQAQQLGPAPLSAFAMRPGAEDNGLVLGYGNTSAELFEPLVKRLSRLASATARGTGAARRGSAG